MSSVSALSQRSTVGLGDREVVVTSRVLFEPEPIIMTEVTADGALLAKSHVTLPRSDTRDPERRDGPALASTLQAHHLRYVHTLIGAEAPRVSSSRPSPYSAGTLGRLRLGPRGEVEEREGEEQVPGTWLRAAYLAVGAFDDIGLGLGYVDRASMRSDGLLAVMARDGESTRVTFVETREALPALTIPESSELERLIFDDQLLGIAAFGPDHVSRGLAGNMANIGVVELESRVRHVTMGTDPPATLVDLVYERGRVLVMTNANGSVVARTSTDVSAAGVLTLLAARTGTVARRFSGELDLDASREAAIDALTKVVLAARRHLGFAVIRNYMKRAKLDTEAEHAWLSNLTFGIDGKVSLEGLVPAKSNRDFVAGAGKLVHAFIARASVVAPAVAEIDLRTTVDDSSEALAALGFFQSKPRETQ